MEKYFENKLSYNRVSFCFTDKPTIDEREIHSYHEILLYFDGDVELYTTEWRGILKKPSVLIIPEGSYHFLKPRHLPEFTRIKISFPPDMPDDTPLSAIMNYMHIIDDPNEEILRACNKLRDVMQSKSNYSAFYAYSAFLTLISELSMLDSKEARDAYKAKNNQLLPICDYISKNLSGRLDIRSISRTVHISESGITHLFKKEFCIPIHQYVLQKRLVYAKKLIESGEQLTKVFSDVGFRDYSSFYKAYTNFFGYAPSKDKHKRKQ